MSFLSLLHRCPTRRANAPWFLSLAALGLVSWSATGTFAQELKPPEPPPPVTFSIQDDEPPLAHLARQPATQPPTLPETRVEAQPPTLPQTNVEGIDPSLIDPNGGYDPAIDGTPFSSRIDPGYRQSESTTGSLIPLRDAENPATVNVISRDLMNDQINLQLGDIIRNAGAVTPGLSDGITRDVFLIRGIQLTHFDFRRDGFSDPTITPRDFQDIERVEILKGAASSLWGAGSPAGTVNLITKKPIDAQFSTFGYTFGSFDRSRFTIDTNGRATESGSVLYRVNAAQEDAHGFVDFDYLSRTSISPIIAWQINDSARLTYYANYHDHNTRGYMGVPVVNGNPLFLPPNTYVGEPANDHFNSKEFRQTLMLEQSLTDEWSLRVGGYSLWYDYPLSVTSASGTPTGFPAVPEPLFYRSRNFFDVAQENSASAQANLVGDFDWYGFRHRMVTGAEYIYFGSNTNFGSDNINPIDVTNPVYVNPPPFGLEFRQVAPLFQHQRAAWYAQDYIDITPQLKLMGGLRIENLNFQYNRTNTFAGFPLGGGMTNQDFLYTAPRAGAVFQPWADDSLAFYFSYGQSFAPPSGGIYVNPTPFKPITGTMTEGGIKSQLLDNLSLNVAGWYSNRNNADLNNSAFFLTQVAQETSKGAEINLIGQITDYWSAVANYAYTDVRLDDPTPPALFDGNRQRGVPYNSANFWTRYNVIQNNEHTFGLALGLVYMDRRPGDLANSFFLPSFGRWDGGIFYERAGGLRATVYLENLGDIHYATNSIDQFTVYQGAPFNVRANVSYSF